LVAWTDGNLWQYETYDDDVTGLIIGAKYNTQTTLPGVLAMAMARLKRIVTNDAMCGNPFATNAVKPT